MVSVNQDLTSAGLRSSIGDSFESTISTDERKQVSAEVGVVEEPKVLIKPSPKRYLVLLIYCICSGNKAFQWIQIPASSDKVTSFYNVSNYTVNFTSTIFMLSFIFLSWPACYLIKLLGLRRAVLLACFIAVLGSTIKCLSCRPGGVYLLFTGQILVSSGEQLIFSVPARLASVWFPDHQVSSAVALTTLGGHLGVALGFLAPQVFMGGSSGSEEIGVGLYNMYLVTAGVSLVAFLAALAFFDEAPEHAPGLARLKQIQLEKRPSAEQLQQARGFNEEMRSLSEQVAALLRNRHYIFLALSYGINLGFCYAISTLLNQMMGPLWSGNLNVIGNTGFLFILGGVLLSPFWGKLLDTLHLYLVMNWFITLANMCALLAFGYALSFMHSEWSIYLSAVLMGTFQTGFVIAGVELAVELTFPAAELVTTSFMNVIPMIFGILFTFIGSHIVDQYGNVTANLFFLASLMVALLLLLCIKEDLRRRKAVIEKQEERLDAGKLAREGVTSMACPQVELAVISRS